MIYIYLNFRCPKCEYHNYSAPAYQPPGSAQMYWNTGQAAPPQDRSVQFTCMGCGSLFFFDLKLEGPT